MLDTAGGQAPEARALSRRSLLAVDLLLAAAVLVVALPIVEPLMAQQASRYALTAALVDHRTVAIDRYEALLTVDRAEYAGSLRSDKAPGQPVLAVPAYGTYRLLGGTPAEVYRPYGNLGLWAVSTWSAAIPAALLLVLMRRAAGRVAPEHATPAALGIAFGTMLLPFATVLFSHVLAGLLLLGAYLLIRDGGRTGSWLAAAGFLAGTAVAVEYSAALAGPVLLGVALRNGGRSASWCLAGGAVPGAGLVAYHWAAFGGPLALPYQYSYFVQHAGASPTVGLPSLPILAEALAGERGLFVLTPIVLVGIAGLVLLVGDPRRRVDGVVGLLVCGAFLALMAAWTNPTGGASPGPRYVVPALPFLVFGVAEAWRRWATVAWMAAGVGVLTMGLATFTLPLAPRDEVAVLWWSKRLLSGDVADVVVPGGGWVLAASGLVALLAAAEAVRRHRLHGSNQTSTERS